MVEVERVILVPLSHLAPPLRIRIRLAAIDSDAQLVSGSFSEASNGKSDPGGRSMWGLKIEITAVTVFALKPREMEMESAEFKGDDSIVEAEYNAVLQLSNVMSRKTLNSIEIASETINIRET